MKALKKYIKKRKSAINIILETQQECFTADTFHKLRIEIKRLNALFHLINYSSKGFKRNKTFKPFKLIFKQAGKVRELQIEESMLKEYFMANLLPEYGAFLRKNLIKKQEAFFSITNITSAKTLKKTFRKISALHTKTNNKKANCYFNKIETKIKKLLILSNLKAKQIHLLRKRLKEHHYNNESLDSTKKNKKNPKKDFLPELLGEWHDYRVTISHLKKVIDSNEINSNENNSLKKIKLIFKFKSESLFQKINKSIQISDFPST